jgi:catechol 2,3-dioxygenase-like lactoylglutathione lyase family enzyme
MMIRGVHHVAMVTLDLARIVAFYRDVLGFTFMGETEWDPNDRYGRSFDRVVGLDRSAAHVSMLRTENVALEFFEYHNPPGDAQPRSQANMLGWRHVAFDVTDLDEVYTRLTDAGVVFHDEPQDLGLARTIYARDPDDNIIEFQELVGPDEHPLELGVFASR